MITLNLGATEALINAAENELGVIFPEDLKEVWRISNGLELPGYWQMYPVFNSKNARKTSAHIVYENNQARWDYMQKTLISIARDDSGNLLVLELNKNQLSEEILVWNHETNKTKKWKKDFTYLQSKAKARVEKIEKQILKSQKRK